MKHFSTLLLAMFAIGASAQSGGTGALLDETYQFTDGGDGLFRYVLPTTVTSSAPRRPSITRNATPACGAVSRSTRWATIPISSTPRVV